MIRMIAGRVPQIAITLALLSLAAYLAIGAMPGDPISLAMMADPRLGPEDVARMRALHGLDQPLLARCGRGGCRRDRRRSGQGQ